MNISIFKLMTSLVVMVLSVGIAASHIEAADYFPLQVGNRWVYTPSFGDGDRIDTIMGTETVNGTYTYIWKREEAAPDNYHEKRWLAKNGSDLEVHKIWGNMVGGDPAIILTPPFIQDKLNPAVGDTWVVELEGIKMTYYVESIDDTVSVPAGTYNNCIRIRILEEQSGSNTYRRKWLAPDIGPVMYKKYTDNWASVKISQELTSFSNIGPLHIDINANRDNYEVNDTLRTYVSIYNVGSCEMTDIYIAVQMTDGTLLFYPGFTNETHPVLPFPINICGSPFMSDYVLFEYIIPITLPKGTYTWYSVLTPPGANPYNSANWLSFDEAPFNVN